MAARNKQGRARGLAPIVCAVALSAALFGCTNTGRNQASPPAAAAVATSDPFVLSGVAYTQGDAQTQRNAVPAPPPTTDVVTAPVGAQPTPVVNAAPLPPAGGGAPATVVGAAPLTPAGLTQAPNAAPAAAPPGAPVSAPPVETADFPNINIPPKQPSGQLLTPEERAKLIQELNSLAGQ